MSLVRALDLCGILSGERFAVAAIEGRRIAPACFDRPADAEAWFGQQSGNLYLTGNPVLPGTTARPSASDVAALRIQLADIDPTGDDLAPAGRAAFDLWEFLGRRGALVDSGRGHQVWVRVDPDVDRALLGRWVAHRFSAQGVKIDGTHDPSRLMRLPGSTNAKTGRVAKVLADGVRRNVSRADVESWTSGWTPPKARAVAPASQGDADPLEVMQWIRGATLEVWEAPPTADRSKRDFLLVLHLLRAGCPQDVACRLMFALPGGKANTDGRDSSYWESTARSVFARLDEDEARASLVASLVASPGPQCMAPEAVKAFASLRANDPVAWQAARQAIKDSRTIRLKDLETAMDSEQTQAVDPPDEFAIYGRTPEGERAGWWLTHDDGTWTASPHCEVVESLKQRGMSGAHMEAARRNPWAVVSVPFQPRALDGRRWNLSRAQWRVSPREGHWPTWRQVLRVVGRGLDHGVAADPWCATYDLRSGADYLFAWIASMAQQPHRPTAYLFCYSPLENIGKSMLHQSLSRHLLAEGSVVDADQALTSEGAFNAELVGAVLCVVEETDLGRARAAALQRLKSWVGNDTLKIHPKGKDVVRVANNTHWYQTSNEAGFCPVLKGDTRITVWEAQPPREEERAEKEDLHAQLASEAPAFLHALLAFALPAKGDGRLAIPAVATDAKVRLQAANTDDLHLWLAATPHWWALSDAEIVQGVQDSLATISDSRYWTRSRVLRSLPTEPRRGLVRALHALGRWEGSPSDLADVVGWQGAPQAFGRALADVDLAVPGLVERSKTRGERRVKVGG